MHEQRRKSWYKECLLPLSKSEMTIFASCNLLNWRYHVDLWHQLCHILKLFESLHHLTVFTACVSDDPIFWKVLHQDSFRWCIWYWGRICLLAKGNHVVSFNPNVCLQKKETNISCQENYSQIVTHIIIPPPKLDAMNLPGGWCSLESNRPQLQNQNSQL